MSLAAGTRLGPYDVVAPLGAGGMGEVYRARDTRLGRTVALKILPEAIANDALARERLTREAQAISSLAHPHICTLFDIGHQDGTDFLVMEYLEGEVLSDRLARGLLPLEDTLTIAAQIAGALAAAHQRGIIHRDLKPANVMLTKSGAKLLDFGIARALPVGHGGATVTAATITAALDRSDRVLGTLPYMAPEVLEGRQADARADVFAFGALLFEMLTGARAFDAGSAAGIIASVMTPQRPSVLSMRPGTPAAIDRLVTACLAKDPADRWQSAQDVALYLAAHADLVPAAPGRRGHASVSMVVAGVVLGVAVGGFAGIAWWRARVPAVVPSPTRLSLSLPDGMLLAPNDSPAAGSSVAISQDGRVVALVAAHRTARALVVRSLDTGEARTLAGTEGAMSPFFSPDGRWVAFFTQSELKKVSVDDGTVISLCRTPPVTRGGVWASDGTIYFSPSFSDAVQRVAAAGGVPTPVAPLQFDAGESNHQLPEILPDNEHLLFTVWKGGSFKDASVWSLSLRTGQRNRLVDSATAPRYVHPGYLVFAREGVLFAAPFDPVRAALTGEAFAVVKGVWSDPAAGTAHYAVGRDGTLVFVAGSNAVEQRRLAWLNRDGSMQAVAAEPRDYGNLRLSPDGTRVAVESLNDIWVYDFRTGVMSRATYRGVNQFPVWTPDGRRIAISSSQGVVVPTLFWIPAEGGLAAERISREGSVQFPASWTSDGKHLLYADFRDGSDTGWDVRVSEPGTNAASRQVVATPFTEDTPMVSPDGRALAYASAETGRREVYVRSFPGQGTRVQVSTSGGTEPVWSKTRSELYFRRGRQLWSVPVQTRGSLAFGRPAVLFEADFVVSSLTPGAPSYDVAPDGRFLIVVGPGEQLLPSHIEVVLNWVEDVNRRAHRTP